MTYLPLFHCEVCPGLLITPAHATLFPLLPSDVEELTTKLIEEVHTAHLSKVIVMAMKTWSSFFLLLLSHFTPPLSPPFSSLPSLLLLLTG